LILQAMCFVLGLVAAGLVGLLVTPAIARRAAKRAKRQLQASLPMNRAEIEAEKDQVRARYALINRRLEASIARLNEQLAGRMVDGSRQREEIGALSRRQTEQAAAIAGLERRAAELTTTLERTEHRLSAANAELQLREERLAARAAEIQHLKSNVAIRDLLTEEQRLELVARETTIGNLHDAIAAAEIAHAALSAERQQLAEGLERERLNVAIRDQQNRESEAARAALEAERVVLAAERAERMADLERRNAEIVTLRAELDALIAERTEIAALHETILLLRAENTELRRLTGAEWESERQDNLRLRERLGEIATIVVRMSETSANPAVADANGHALANGHAVPTVINGNGHAVPPIANGNGHTVPAVTNGHAAPAITNGNGNGHATPAATNGNGHANAQGNGNGSSRPVEPLPGRPDTRDPRSLAHRLRSIQRVGTRH
jgi:hypothetical protein